MADLGSAVGQILLQYDGSGVAAAKADLGTLGTAGTSAAQQLTTAGATAAGIGGIIAGGLGLSIKSAADFEFAIDGVNAALGGLDTSTLADIEEQALDIGAASKFSATEIAGVQQELAKTGLNAEQLLGGATQSVVDLAAATGEQLVPAGNAAAAAINLFGLSTEQIPLVADTITAGLNNSSASLSDFQRGVNNLGPVMANLARYADAPEEAFQDTAAAVAFFNANGLKAADAGISLARGMTNLATAGSTADQVMQELGISAFDTEGNFLPLPELFDQLNESMSGMSDQAREAALATIFGAEAADVMNQAIKQGGDPLREYEDLMRQQGIAAEQAALRQDNLTSAVEQLGGALNAAMIALGQPFLAPLKDLARGVTSVVDAFVNAPPALQGFVSGFAALSAGFLLIGGGAALAAGQVLKLAQTFSAAGLSLGRFVGVIGIAGLALAALVAAYQTNFLGFADLVNATLARAQKAIETFGKTFEKVFNQSQRRGLNVVAAGLRAFGRALEDATGIDFVDQFDQAAQAVQAAGDAFQFATENGFNPATTGLFVLAEAAEALELDAIADALHFAAAEAQEFGNVFEQAFATESEQRLSGLAAGIAAFGTALSNAIGIDVTGFFDGIADGIDIFTAGFNAAVADGINPFEAALLGLRDVLSSIVGIDLAPIFDRLGDAAAGARESLAEFISTIQAGDIGGALGNLAQDLLGALGGLKDALGPALQQLSTDAQTKLQELSDALASQLDSIDLGEVALNVANWIGETAWPSVVDFIKEHAGVDLSAGIDIGEIALTVAGWAISAAQTVADAVRSFVFGDPNSLGGPGERGEAGTASAGIAGAIDLGQIAVTVASWVVSAATSVWDAIRVFLGIGGGSREASAEVVTGAGMGDDQGGITLSSVLVNISSWAQGTLAPIGDLLKGWITEHLNAAAVAIENFTGWSLTLGLPGGGGASTQAAKSPLTGTSDLTQIIEDQLVAAAITVEDFTGWDLTVKSPEGGIEIDGEGIKTALNTAVKNALTVDESFVAQAGEIGQDLGNKLGTALGTAVSQAMQSSFAGGGGAGGIATQGGGGGFSLGDALANFDQQFTLAFISAMDPEFAAAEQSISDYMTGKFGELALAALNAPISIGPLFGGSGAADAPTDIGGRLGLVIRGVGDPGGSFEQAMDPTMAEIAASANNVGRIGGEETVTQLDAGLASGVGFGATWPEAVPVINAAFDSLGGTVKGGIENLGDDLFGAAEAGAQEIAPGITEPIVSGVETGTSDAAAQIPGAVESAALATALDSAMATQFAGVSLAELSSAIGLAINAAILEGVSGTADTMGGPGERGEAGTASAGIGNQIVATLAADIASADSAPIAAAMQALMASAFTGGEGGGGEEGGEGGVGAAAAQSLVASIASNLGAQTEVLSSALGAVLSAAAAGATAAGGGKEGGGLSSVGTSIISAIASSLGPATGTLTSALQAVITAAIAGANATAATANTVGTAMITAVGTGIGAATGTATAAMQAAVQASIDGGNATAAGASVIGTALTTAIGTGIGAGTGTVIAAIQAAVAAAIAAGNANAFGAAQVIGLSIAQGIAAGVGAGTGAIVQAVQAAVATGVAAAAAAAESGSPSRLFAREVGVPIAEGMAMGVEQAAPAFLDSVAGLVESGVDVGAQSIVEGSKLWESVASQLGIDTAKALGTSLTENLPDIGEYGAQLRDQIMSRVSDMQAAWLPTAEGLMAQRNTHAAGLLEREQGRADQQLEATVVIEDDQMGQYVLGKALVPLIAADRKAGRRKWR